MADSRVNPVSKTGLYAKSPSALVVRARKVRRLVERLRRTMPWLVDSDLPACRAWAELEILGAGVFAALMTDGFVNAEGEPRKLLTEYRHLRRTQLAFEHELGMTPAARLAIKATDTSAAFDLAARLATADTAADEEEYEENAESDRPK